MRYAKETLGELAQQKLRYKIKSEIVPDVIKNISGAFEKYYFFVAKKKPIPQDEEVPEIYFELKSRKCFEDLFILRKTNPDANAKFIREFRTADFLGVFTDLFDVLKKYYFK